MKILITGDAGFVGGYFHKELDGHDIVGVDIKNNLDARTFFAKDDTYFDLVIHLAAIVGGRATIEGEPLSVAVDLAIDSELFQWALRTRPGRIVYYSSSAAYPISLQGYGSQHHLVESDIDLNDIKSPDYTYGWAKLTGEMLAGYAEKEGLRVHVFRPFSGYGEDQSLDYPFPSFIKRGVEKDNPFKIWGTGNQARDFIHMEDVVAATLEAVKQDIQGPVNLGLGRATSFNELADLVAKECGYSPEYERIIGAPEGVQYRACDPSKMLSFYTPKISLEEGIARAVKYFELKN
jgi:nucleoside-diphosphate-sugar epimerase